LALASPIGLGAEREIGYEVAQLLFQLVIKAKVGTAALAALLFLSSCGGGSRPQTQSDATTAKRQVAITPTTMFRGEDCNESELQKYFTQSAFRGLSENPKPEQLRSLMMSERQRIRSLDLPTLQREKQELVDSMEQMIIELTQAITNQRRSGTYDAALIRWDDAGEDFRNAYVRECEGL
jgi:hypothetical protein